MALPAQRDDEHAWYETAFKALQETLGADVPPVTKSNLQQFVVAVRQRESQS